MIKAIIADVDGVMVGGTHGVNFPLPHRDVIAALKKIREEGTLIVLCTAKFHAAIDGIISQANLNNPHISDGGALIIDPIDKIIVSKHVIDKKISKSIVRGALDRDVYVECYTYNNYYIQESEVGEFTKKKTDIVQKEPEIVEYLVGTIEKEEIIKINAYCDNKKEKIEEWGKFLRDFQGIHSIWTTHPSIPEHRSTTITKLGVSKASAVKELIKTLDISFDEVLGIGDTASDWNFMELCKFTAMVGNESKDLRKLIQSGKRGNYFISPSVEDNGLLEVFRHFRLAE